MSPFAKSETRYVTPIRINLEGLGYHKIEEILLVDTPGSGDTVSKEVDIANGFGIIKAI